MTLISSFLIVPFRFPPADTNLVLREFEKCGVILKHVPGPRDANWMHILYQVLLLFHELQSDMFLPVSFELQSLHHFHDLNVD